MAQMLSVSVCTLALEDAPIARDIFSHFGIQEPRIIVSTEDTQTLWGNSCNLQVGSEKDLAKIKGHLAIAALRMKAQTLKELDKLGCLLSCQANAKEILSVLQPGVDKINDLLALRTLKCAAASPYHKDVRAITEGSEGQKVVANVAKQMDRAIRGHRKQQRESDEREMRMAFVTVYDAIMNPGQGKTRRQVLAYCRNTLPLQDLSADIGARCLNALKVIEEEIEQLETGEAPDCSGASVKTDK